MAQDVTEDRSNEEQFDLDCLRHIMVDAETQRLSLAAAMIKVRALAIARSAPGQREDALEIIRYTEELHAGLPAKGDVRQMVENHLIAAAFRFSPRLAAATLADDIWDLFRRGRR